MVANILPADPPPPTLGVGLKEYGHLAYQIEGNAACSNLVTNIMP